MTSGRREAGVTLVELLVVIAVAGVVLPGLGGALLIGWRTTDETVARLSDNRNRVIAPSLFTRDAQSAQTVDTNTTSGACLQPGDTLVVRFRWTETPSSGTATTSAAAWVTRGVSGQTILERRFCTDASGSMTAVSSVSTVYGVAGTPVVTCRAAGGTTSSCSSAVQVDLSLTDAAGAVELSGRRRSA